MPESSPRYRHIGPAEVLAAVRPGHLGQPVSSPDDLVAWLAARDGGEREEPFTFVVDLAGTLRLAPQRSEHVACADRVPVLNAGKVTFGHDGER